jgi:hypothetical protein
MATSSLPLIFSGVFSDALAGESQAREPNLFEAHEDANDRPVNHGD